MPAAKFVYTEGELAMLRLSHSIRRTKTQDGGILLDIERGQMFSLNTIGGKILDLVEEGSDEGQIAEYLSAVCGTNVESVRADVRAFLESMTQFQILKGANRTHTTESGGEDDDSART